jgi:hypothetical protein
MANREKKIRFFQDMTATLEDGLAWIAPVNETNRRNSTNERNLNESKNLNENDDKTGRDIRLRIGVSAAVKLDSLILRLLPDKMSTCDPLVAIKRVRH